MTTATPAGVSHQSLDDWIDHLAHTPHLLVACDYDGTLAPIVADPSQARPLRESLVALRLLSEQEYTHAAVISGRALSDLAALMGLPDAVHLVGSHGSEFDPGFLDSLTSEQQALRREVSRALKAIAEGGDGLSIEEKPASVALHYRNAAPPVAEKAVEAVSAGPAGWQGVFVKRGKMVIELAVIGTHKGDALQAIRQRVGAHVVVFIGDDATDEDAFATLRGPDLGIKVGEGSSLATLRVKGPRDVARVLGRLAERRSAWLCGSDVVPIEHHSMLSDQRTIALVTPNARITWMCAPRIDSPSLFAELVGGPPAGYFSIGPVDESPAVSQQYEGDSLVLRTKFRDFEVVDYLDCSFGRAHQRAGRSDLVRIVNGTGRVRMEFAPRLDFSRTTTRLRAHEDGLHVLDSPEPIVLHSPGVAWEVRQDGKHETAVAVVDLPAEPFVVTLRIGSGTLRARGVPEKERFEQTLRHWQGWAERLRPPALARDLVMRSALTLKALIYGPSGGIAAAATTSLPEAIGGVRNWDYRYCWPRDAALAATALVKLGLQAEAMHLLDWLLVVVERAVAPDRLAPLYTVSGDELSTEGEIGELAGYAGSRPVRVGNAASRQVQLDVFGPVVDLTHELMLRDAPLTPQHWRVVEAMVAAVHVRWNEPDHGIWEVRSAPQHHVHSRVMCWVTLDRAIKASRLAMDRVPDGWEDMRDRIAHDVLEKGWNEEVGAFVAAYGFPQIDASTLLIGISGLLAPSDERFIRTVEAVERELLDGSAVYRYRYDDGLPGVEGAFNICTSWLILSYHLLGRRQDAMNLFERYLSLAGPTGLMSEEYGAASGLALGNFPQTYSHSGLIECALALSENGADPSRNGALGS